MSDDSQRPIVVKRIKKGGGGHHGGAWKIAYADFVTAMMAFFLLMWLLGSTTKGDLKGIADFFQSPLKVAMQGGDGSGASTSLLAGGGKDLTRRVGEEVKADYKEPKKNAKVRITSPEQEAIEKGRLQGLKKQIAEMIEKNPDLGQYKNQILLELTTEGLRIQIVDEQNRPMFDSASAEVKPYTRSLMRMLGQALNDTDNKISIAGHTDASRYAGGDKGFSNWELSAGRANSCRRELIAGGLSEGKIVRVIGLAAILPLDSNDPFSPINRRISIMVMNRQATEAMMTEARAAEDEPVDVAPAAAPMPKLPP